MSTSDTSNPPVDEAVIADEAVAAVASIVAGIEAEAGEDVVIVTVAVATANPGVAAAATVAGVDHVMEALSTSRTKTLFPASANHSQSSPLRRGCLTARMKGGMLLTLDVLVGVLVSQHTPRFDLPPLLSI